MKPNTFIILLATIFTSCNSQSSKENLKPKLELINNDIIKWQEKEYKLDQIDSLLKTYKKNVSQDFQDSIRIELIVNTKVLMGTVADVKIALWKNKLLKITYVPKK